MSQEEARKSAIAKAGRRLIPFLCLCYAVNFLDRVNVGFAALDMNQDLGFSPSVFGAGAGIFFAGYILFEVPSNLAMQKFGARIWIARIMISWGILAIAMAFVSGETSFYVMRFLLGVAEAGFFPGIILYLTYWFPARERARIPKGQEVQLVVLPERKGLLDMLMERQEEDVLARAVGPRAASFLRWATALSDRGPIARAPFDVAVR